MSEENGVERRIVNESRFTKLEEQVARLVSDAESEKDTRRRSNVLISTNFAGIDIRLRHIELKLYGYSCVIAVFVLVIHWVFK